MGKFEKVLIVIGVVVVCLGSVWLLVILPRLLRPKDYRDYVSIEVELVRGARTTFFGKPVDMLKGFVRNDGDRTVTYADVTFSLLDEDGVQLAGRSELIAHRLPFGDNNTPIPAHSRKRFQCPIRNVPADWDGEIKWTIEQIMLK